MNFIKVYLKAKLKMFINSRFFLFLLALTIGITGTYIYLEAPKLFDTNTIVMDFNRRALASEVALTQEEVVSATSHQSFEAPTDNISVESLIQNAFGADAKIALAIAKAESNLEVDRVGDKHIMYEQDGKTYGMSCGVFQIRTLPGRPSCEEMLDPEKNIAFAKQLYDKSGWTPWTVWKTNQYKNFL